MKKIKFTIIAALLMIAATLSAQVDLGVKGGLNLSTSGGKFRKAATTKLGFHAGLSADVNVAPNIAIQSGILATTKGYRVDNSYIDYTANMVFLQVPVHFAYIIDVMPGTKVVLHGGPFAAYGIGGKFSYKRENLGIEYDEVFGTKDLQFKNFDYGVGIGAGFEFGKIITDIGWDMGLIDLSNGHEDIRTLNAYLSLGYKF